MEIQKLTSQRKQLGLTQQKLAELAGVSLPTVQNIERGIANPSLDVLMKLIHALGLNISITESPINWDELALLGVPLTVSKNTEPIKPNAQLLLIKLRSALVACHPLPSDRKMEALAATLLALKTHWPSLFKKLGPLKNSAEKFIERHDLERLLKLRSLAIAQLQGYL